MADHRSPSQYNQYTRCPYAYYLSRLLGAWEKPAAWSPQGTAVHKAVEQWERSNRSMPLEEAEQVFVDSYVSEINLLSWDTPNWRYWFNSGPYRGEEDTLRRYEIGLEQVGKYVEYFTKQAPEEVVWITPDGEPAIELEMQIDYDGVLVRGYIDLGIQEVLEHTDDPPVLGDVRPRDVKSGNKPGGPMQIATYGDYFRQKWGVEVVRGDFFMCGKQGKKPHPVEYRFDDWHHERLTQEYQWLDENIRAERFDPDPEPDKCRFCSVQSACIYAA